jgi:hypothetical protein
MIAAAHLDNFLFLIFFAVAILFQLLTRAASKAGRRPGDDQKGRPTSPPQTPRSTPRQLEETEEDRVRKFLEALGQPTSSKPPLPVTTRPYKKPMVLPRVEPRRIARPVLSPLPPLTTKPEIPTFEVQESPPPPAPISGAEVAAAFKPEAAQPVSKSEASIDVVTLLKSTSGLRNAIILREIFGPPRSLQPLDLVGNI